MPFEPLQTDERTEGPPRRELDFDSQMMFGCTQFVVQSLCVYGLSAWPHFVFTEVHLVGTLALNMAIGFLPAYVQSLFGAKRFGLPSAVGSMGGSLAFGIFLYLRLQQIHAPSGIRGAPIPEWPKEWIWLIPVAEIVVFAASLFLVVPKEQWRWSDRDDSPTIAGPDSDN